MEDYPLLPVRRRFWEHTLRAVDKAGTAGQLRTQLRIVYEAARRTADDPLGTVVPADFLFEEKSNDLLQSGVLLREIHETIVRQRTDGTLDGELKSRLCALVFLIRKLPREAGADIGVRATAEAMADLLVENLARDGAALRARLPALLDELVESGTLMKVDNEYSLQTRESSEWEAEFRNRQTRLANDHPGMSSQARSVAGRRGSGRHQVDPAPARRLQGTQKARSAFRCRTAGTGRLQHPCVDTGRLGRQREQGNRRRAHGGAGQLDTPCVHTQVPCRCVGAPNRYSWRCQRYSGIQRHSFNTRRERGSPGNADAAQRSRQQSANAGDGGNRWRQSVPRRRE